MSPSLATIVCWIGIAVLFYLDRERTPRTSKALWLPVIWVWIIGSRPVSEWLGFSPASMSAAQAADGSPLDAAVFGMLLAGGVIVLIYRRRSTIACLKANWPCLLFFFYCLLSVLWSDFPALASKRWIKAIGDLVMVLVIVTDVEPVAAVGRLISRTGFILMPTSVLLIKYFGNLGRGYDPDGIPMNTGVTSNKNMLGVITLVISLGALWRLLNVLLTKHRSNRARLLLARGILLAFCISVLLMAQSATSISCFMLGAVLLVGTQLPLIRNHSGAVHALVAGIVIVGGVVMLSGGEASVVHALGRKTNLTGRTEIWAAVLPLVPNPIVGAGFESFWLGPRLQEVYSHLSKYMHVNEAHNGYIEVYLNLGWIGVGLIAAILISGYRGAVAAFRRRSMLGSLMLAYVAAAAIYSVSEAGFRMLDPMWFFLLLAVIGSRAMAYDKRNGTGKPIKTLLYQERELHTALAISYR